MKPLAIIIISIAFIGCKSTNTALNKSGKQPESKRASDSIIASGALPFLVSNQFAFTEGPAADKKGNIFFTDQPNNKIWKYSTEGILSVFRDSSRRSNGLYFDNSGNLISCADENNQLISFDSAGNKTVLVNNVQDSILNGPNDVWVSPSGNMYFTDPYYERPYWKTGHTHKQGEFVYLLPKQSNTPTVVIGDFKKPNGIIGTPDGQMLYVADLGAGKTYQYKIDKNGMLSDKKLFADQGSDGMTIDNRGNIYLTGNGVTVYNKQGEKINHIAIPQPWTANVCFGGTNKNILFITASTAVYTLQMNVKAAGY